MRRIVLNRRRLAAGAAILTAVFAAAAAFRQWVLPYCVPLPEEELARRIPARRFFDRAGRLLHSRPGFDYEWRFPVRLDALPAHLVEITLAVEDRNFHRHDGVDLAASARAFWQFLKHGRIVSGSSTVTMQLMNLADRRPRSWFNKLRQMELARGWEKKHSKREILEAYFNYLPYGGKLYGVEAAARYYFGRSASELNFAECTLLAGIPQRPNRFRPDRHPEAARRRQKTVLEMLVRRKLLTAGEAGRIYAEEPLRYRDFSLPLWRRAADPQFFELAERSAEAPLPERVTVTLDPELQDAALALLKRSVALHPSVHDGALAVLENRTGKVRALVGTLDFGALPAGQVNAAVAYRSPGSALKPFLFGEAVEGGMLAGDTVLDDSPLLYGGYRPGNFDGTFRGRVSAETALAESLNTPAVRLLRSLGTERVKRTLSRFGLWRPGAPAPDKLGLSLALGSLDVTLLDLANAYRAIASGGIHRPFLLLEDTAVPAGTAVWSAGSCEMLASMLRSRALPEAGGLPVAWKTGTSNGNRDAWCIAFTPEWTVGVWFGNKDGTPSPDLVGGPLAAPAAGAMMRTLYRNAPPPEWPEAHREITALCRRSGLRPGMFCGETFPGAVVRGIPLQSCRDCRREANAKAPKPTAVVTPAPGTYRAEAGGGVRFRLDCAPAEVHFYLDNRYQGKIAAGSGLVLAPGTHRLLFWGGDGYRAASMEIRVLPPRNAERKKAPEPSGPGAGTADPVT